MAIVFFNIHITVLLHWFVIVIKHTDTAETKFQSTLSIHKTSI